MSNVFNASNFSELTGRIVSNFMATVLAINIAVITSLYCVGYIDTVQKGDPDIHWYVDLEEHILREGDGSYWIAWIFLIGFNLFIAFPVSLAGVVLFRPVLFLVSGGTLYMIYWALTATAL